MKKPARNAVEIKIAYIGGGSRGWAHSLINDLTLCEHLTGRVALYDLDQPMAKLNARWGRRVNASPQAKSTWKYTVAKTLAEALKGADFVIASILPGPIEMMRHDLEIPRQYGIIHTVGDTAGPAGLCRALRSVPQYAKIARAIARHCPDAWVINYTNPMTVCMRTLYKVFPQIKAFGCCHEVFGTQGMLAGLVEQYVKSYKGRRPTRDDIRVNVLGVNHFTWIDRATCDGIDLLELFARHSRKKGVTRKISDDEIQKMSSFGHKGQVTIDLFRRYGILPAAGERHLVEFVPFYLRDEKTMHRWGVKCTPYSWRIDRHESLPRQFRRRLADKTPFDLPASGEEGVRQMMAILGLGDMRTNVNLPNVGQIENLPTGAVVETNAWFTRDSVKPEPAGRLPAGVHALVARVVACQELTVDAALARDKHLAFQALLNDPLTALPTDTAYAMFTQMLRATRASLPGWKI